MGHGAAAALIVAALLGTLARQRHLPPSCVLLPLSYAAILGGITTLIGTSTNLVVSAFAVEAGLPPLGMFDLAWAGVPIAVVCLIVLAIGSRHLPLHQGGSEEQAQRYFLEARVMPGAPLVGRTIEQNRLRQLDGLGRMSYEAAVSRDYPVVFGTLFIFTLAGLLIRLIGDVCYTLLDPRIDFDTRAN